MPIVKMSVFGRSEQTVSTGANIFNVNAGGVGWINPDTGVFNPNNSSNYVSDFIAVKPNTVYSINFMTNYFYFYNTNKQFVRKININNNSFTTMNDEVFVRFAISQDANAALKMAGTIIINEGSVLKSFEPYTGGKPAPSPECPMPITNVGDKGSIEIVIDEQPQQKMILSTPNGLPGIKVDTGGNYTDSTGQQWVCDEIDLARGKYIKNLDKALLNGTETFVYYQEYSAFGIQIPCRFDVAPLSKMYRFVTGVSNLKNNQAGISGGTRSICFRDDSCNGNIELWKQKLKNKPIDLIYALKSPSERELTSEEIAVYKNLCMNYPVTTISNDENCDMELTYTVDTKSYVDKKIAELSGAVIASAHV